MMDIEIADDWEYNVHDTIYILVFNTSVLKTWHYSHIMRLGEKDIDAYYWGENVDDMVYTSLPMSEIWTDVDDSIKISVP